MKIPDSMHLVLLFTLGGTWVVWTCLLIDVVVNFLKR